MMPGATPPIAGTGQRPRAQRSCTQLATCQWREPPCLDCPNRYYAPPPGAAGQEAVDARDADDVNDMAPAIVEAIVAGLAVGLGVIAALVMAGYLWQSWIAP